MVGIKYIEEFNLLNDLHLHTRTHLKKTLEIHFIYLGNKEIYCIFKTCCVICVLFSTKCHLCHNFIFVYSNDTFFINQFKYLP
jgi:hypothetical protein